MNHGWSELYRTVEAVHNIEFLCYDYHRNTDHAFKIDWMIFPFQKVYCDLQFLTRNEVDVRTSQRTCIATYG